MEVFFGLLTCFHGVTSLIRNRFFFFLLRLKLDFSNSDFFDLYKLEPHPLKGDSVSQSILCHLS